MQNAISRTNNADIRCGVIKRISKIQERWSETMSYPGDRHSSATLQAISKIAYWLIKKRNKIFDSNNQDKGYSVWFGSFH